MAEHTKLPWEAVELRADGRIITRAGYEIRTPDYDVVAQHPSIPPIRKAEDAQYILLACNNFERLKEAAETLTERAGTFLDMLQAINITVPKPCAHASERLVDALDDVRAVLKEIGE